MLTLLLTLCSFLFVSAMLCTVGYTAFRLGTITHQMRGHARLAGKRYYKHGTWYTWHVIPYGSKWITPNIMFALSTSSKHIRSGLVFTWLTRRTYRLAESHYTLAFNPYYYINDWAYRAKDKENYGLHYDISFSVCRLEFSFYGSVHSFASLKRLCMRYQDRENERRKARLASY